MPERPPAGAPWIRVREVSFAYGVRDVLTDIDLALHPGRHYVVAGPNGAGKSTLLNLIAALRRPTAGSIDVMGDAVATLARAELARRIALAPQEYRLNFPFTIREIVAMARKPYLGRWGRLGAEDWRVVDEAVGLVRLEAIADKPVTALSGGERRRCVVARALAQATPILLLDEPTAGLDVAQALAVMALARRLAENGSLVVTVSHDLNLAACYGHELVFLKAGRVTAAGPVEAVFTDDVLSAVYETGARVRRDDFGGGLAVSFRHDGGRR